MRIPRLLPAIVSALTLCALLPAIALAQSAPGGSTFDPVELPVPEVPDSPGKARFERGTVLVKFKEGTREGTQDVVLGREGAEQTGDQVAATGYDVAELDPDVTVAEAVRELEEDPTVLDAQPNYIRTASATPNDPALASGDQSYLKHTRFIQGWDLAKGASSRTIAILDTGIDLDHPDLKARLKPGYNAVNPGASPNDGNGHGTMVAGIAGAVTNNGRGVAGAAWNASLMPVKVLKDDGSGTDADIAEGITWAADHGASVINLSLGGPGSSAVLSNAVNYAFSKNVVVVAAAGNDGTSLKHFPAAYGGVIAVTATDASTSGTFAYFSNHGWWVDVAAPGMNIVSTLAGSGELYAIGDGTSFAAPLVAGVAFMVRSKFPSMTVGQIAYRIRSTARDQGPPGYDPSYGTGRLDAYAALGGAKASPFTGSTSTAPEPNDTYDRAAVIPVGSSWSDTMNSTIHTEYDVDWFSTEAPRGNIGLRVDPPDVQADPPRALEMDAAFEVYDPQGRRIAQVDSAFAGEAEVALVQTPVAGTYRIKVWNYFGSRSPGAYSILIERRPSEGPYFNDRIKRSPGGLSPSSLATGDVNGDGRTDIVTPVGGQLHVYAQGSDGSIPETSVAYPLGSTATPNLPAIAELTGDGRPDVLVATGSAFNLFEQTAGGTLAAPTQLPVSASVSAFDLVDVLGDGGAEIFAATPSGIKALTRTDGVWIETAVVSDAFQVLKVADVTGDGRVDLVTQWGSAVRVYAQTPGARFAEPVAYAGAGGSGLEVADVTGDGRNDVLVTDYGYYSDGLRVFAQNETGTLDPPTEVGLGGFAIAVGDADDNGIMDILTSQHSSSSLYTALPGGGFGEGHHPLQSVGARSNALADVNGDELLDIVTASNGSHPSTSGLLIATQQSEVLVGPQLWITNQTPADQATGIPTVTSPTLVFAKDLDASTVNGGTIALVNANTMAPVPSHLTYNPGTGVVTIDPVSALASGTPFVIAAWLVRDTDGAYMNDVYLSRFKTS